MMIFTRSLSWYASFSCFLVLSIGIPPSVLTPTYEDCAVESDSVNLPDYFTRHLGPGCDDREREAYAVTAEELLSALKAGRGIDLKGVVVTGDLLLDQLPVVEAKTYVSRSALVEEMIRKRNIQELRMIAGPISITQSFVRGSIVTNLHRGLLVVTGPVTMTDTTFDRSIDFSHTIFLEPVDFAQAVIKHESFFIQTVFGKKVRFEKAAFGIRSRFHKAVFYGPATFNRAGFNGLAEFLEASFREGAHFTRAHFKMGTGFSGSQFHGKLDFSEALFEREAFFSFALFEDDASFRRATFLAQADFSDTQFKGADDFSKAFFGVEPKFRRVRVSGILTRPSGLQASRYLYGVAAVLLLCTVIFVLILRK